MPEEQDFLDGALEAIFSALTSEADETGYPSERARDLTAASKMQDCVMSGRRNCNVIEPAR